MKSIGVILLIIGIAILLFTLGYFLFWIHWGAGLSLVGLIFVVIGGIILKDD